MRRHLDLDIVQDTFEDHDDIVRAAENGQAPPWDYSEDLLKENDFLNTKHIKGGIDRVVEANENRKKQNQAPHPIICLKKGKYYLLNPNAPVPENTAEDLAGFWVLTADQYSGFCKEKKIKPIFENAWLEKSLIIGFADAIWQAGCDAATSSGAATTVWPVANAGSAAYLFNVLSAAFYPFFLGFITYWLNYNRFYNQFVKEQGRKPNAEELEAIKTDSKDLAWKVGVITLGWEVAYYGAQAVMAAVHFVPHVWLMHLILISAVALASGIAAATQAKEGERLKAFFTAFLAGAAWYATNLIPGGSYIAKFFVSFAKGVITLLGTTFFTALNKQEEAKDGLGAWFARLFKPEPKPQVPRPGSPPAELKGDGLSADNVQTNDDDIKVDGSGEVVLVKDIISALESSKETLSTIEATIMALILSLKAIKPSAEASSSTTPEEQVKKILTTAVKTAGSYERELGKVINPYIGVLERGATVQLVDAVGSPRPPTPSKK